MSNISFYSQKIPFKISNPRKTANWLRKICAIELRVVDSVDYIFCSDAYLLELNKAYLKHSTYTDILSFDFSEGENISGEIYISVPRVRENAKSYQQPFDREMRRVLVHGLLHFLGYKDKSPSQKAEMRSKEEACLSLWK